jgi:MtN3 and saliva related transmembrane protein
MTFAVVSESVGLTGAFLTTTSFCPQVFKLWRTKDASGVSGSMFVIFAAGTAAWLAYGVMIHSPSVIAANAISFCLAATVLYFKHKYSDKGPRDHDDGHQLR